MALSVLKSLFEGEKGEFGGRKNVFGYIGGGVRWDIMGYLG